MNKAGRNDPCPCGSGLKYKKCCEIKKGQPKKFTAQAIQASSSDVAGKVNSVSRLFQTRSSPPSPESKDHQ